MAKFRMVYTEFWTDPKVIEEMTPEGTEFLEISIKRSDDTPNLNCIVDGVQCVPKDRPSVFLTDTELYRFYDGLAGASPRKMNVREDMQVGWNIQGGFFNFSLQENGLLISRNNSQFSVSHTPVQNLPADTWVKVNFRGSVFIDWHEEFNNTVSEFRPKQSGVYVMQVNLGITNIPQGALVGLRLIRSGVEDTRLFLGPKPAGTSTMVLHSTALTFAGDNDSYWVEAYVGLAGASTIVAGAQSSWKAFRIGGRR